MPFSAESQRLPNDYLERVYAGVLGKLIGVYVGRPFENWTHQRIVKELGHIRYYVHEQFDEPLVITDDDVSGTFQFVRALEEHGVSEDITSREIGRTWLNSVIEHRTVFWWGGRGVSTEHTAFLNLKHGIPAPLSGSIDTNGKTVAEQIGAQIFIDGWALVSPGNPRLAAKLARAAGSVSHDGESIYAAQLWAAMEAEAFLSKDVYHLIDTGLSVIPAESLIARLVSDVRAWAKVDGDWLKTRQRIEDNYGYDKFSGTCHVVPNHGVMIMALIYGGHSFDEAMHIVNTCGWDTDCNSGNLGCLVALMHGISSFGGLDWRGPLADRALISSADAGYSVNNAARIALDLVTTGRRLAGLAPLPAPKGGAQFHFTLPGSVQGFQVLQGGGAVSAAQDVDAAGNPGLAIRANRLDSASGRVEVSTETFTPKDIVRMKVYNLMASPLVYPGQTIHADVSCDADATGDVRVGLRLQVYTNSDELRAVDGPEVTLSPGKSDSLSWTIPDNMDSQPIQRLGLALGSTSGDTFTGTVRVDKMHWRGAPTMTIRRPEKTPCDFWYRAWVNGADTLHRSMPRALLITQSKGEGIITHGTRDWANYRVFVPKFKVALGSPGGVAARVQGLNRYYAVVFVRGRRVALVKALDEERITLVSAACGWELDEEYNVTLEVEGENIRAFVGDRVSLHATDRQYAGGGIGLIATDGSVSADRIRVEAL